MRRLLQILRDLDGKPYGQLRRLQGDHADRDMAVVVDHVQGDPYAPPSRLHLELSPTFHPNLRLPTDRFERLAAEDLFLREFAARLNAESLPAGDGAGGRLRTCRPDSFVRPRSGATFHKMLSLRFCYNFPAQSRRILAEPAAEVLINRLSGLALELAGAVTLDRIEALAAHLRERESLRATMEQEDLVAFLPEGCTVRRQPDGKPVPRSRELSVPQGLAATLTLPDGRSLRGLGVRRGVTVVVGGAFQGKSTLLEALRDARADFAPGDGLASALALASTESVTVEEDRAVATRDLSPFFRRLPGHDPRSFHCEEASGSTSQAANLLEALETGSRLLLIDEDASAANFLTRDDTISSLLPGGEPVVPLAHRCRELRDRGVSLVVVAGASSAWLPLADQVIAMADYQPVDVTAKAKETERPAPAAPATADWDSALADRVLDTWKELAGVPTTKLRVQDGLVRFARVAQARLPRRFSDEDTLRGAAHLLCAYLRHARDRALVPTLKGLLEFVRVQRHHPDPWGPSAGHDLAFPVGREVWALWTRLRPGSADGEELE